MLLFLYIKNNGVITLQHGLCSVWPQLGFLIQRSDNSILLDAESLGNYSVQDNGENRATKKISPLL